MFNERLILLEQSVQHPVDVCMSSPAYCDKPQYDTLLQQYLASLQRQPNTTASAMPCYDTRLRLIPRHPSAVLHLRCPSTMPKHDACTIPSSDTQTRHAFPPSLPDPSTTSLEMPIATTRATLYTTTTNALYPCTLILVLFFLLGR
jgi:hypothetical protein